MKSRSTIARPHSDECAKSLTGEVRDQRKMVGSHEGLAISTEVRLTNRELMIEVDVIEIQEGGIAGYARVRGRWSRRSVKWNSREQLRARAA